MRGAPAQGLGAKRRELTCLFQVPDVARHQLRRLLALHAARPEDLAALVADHEVVLAALALGLGRPPQQAAVTASLGTQGQCLSMCTRGSGHPHLA